MIWVSEFSVHILWLHHLIGSVVGQIIMGKFSGRGTNEAGVKPQMFHFDHSQGYFSLFLSHLLPKEYTAYTPAGFPGILRIWPLETFEISTHERYIH